MTTYTKLRSGEWGLRIAGPDAVAPGAQIEVTRRDGTPRVERVGRIVWRGDGVALATIARSEDFDLFLGRVDAYTRRYQSAAAAGADRQESHT